jgi:cell division protein ZapE
VTAEPLTSPLHSLLERYRMLRETGRLQPDAAQARAAAILDTLGRALAEYRPERRGFFRFGRHTPEAPKGLYLYGAVGRGKSLLMDIFFASAVVMRKRRVHFNAFMLEVHERIHQWRALSHGERRRRPEFVGDAGEDPIAPVAKWISQQAMLLCFDEFQVTDIADAMILGRLFEKLFLYGVVIVATSNTEPDKLYEGGLNRALFLPFIALMKERLNLLELDSPHDYRLERMAGRELYITPLGPKADAAMDEAWLRLTDTKKGHSIALKVMGRTLVVPESAKGVARFSFDHLCGQVLGTADYLALARTFHTLFIDRIPKLSPEQRNEARRFTLLVDSLYDEKVKLVCSAAALPFDLYIEGDNADSFKRAASRLTEMQSARYAPQDLNKLKAVWA